MNGVFCYADIEIHDLAVQELNSPAGTCDPLCSVDEMSSSDFQENYKPKTDLLKAVAVGAAVLTGAAVVNHSWVAENQVWSYSLHFFPTPFVRNVKAVPFVPLPTGSLL